MQSAQNVHSNVQMRASVDSLGKSLLQHSQLGRSASIALIFDDRSAHAPTCAWRWRTAACTGAAARETTWFAGHAVTVTRAAASAEAAARRRRPSVAGEATAAPAAAISVTTGATRIAAAIATTGSAAASIG